jgi:hypothetical protein
MNKEINEYQELFKKTINISDIINKYQELYKKYDTERIIKTKECLGKYSLNEFVDPLNSVEHPCYFEIKNEWDEINRLLDEPLIKLAKYKVGDCLEFIKWDTKVLSKGIVTNIAVSGSGSGEIRYDFSELEPPCKESNPYCLEKDAIKIIT